MNRLDLVGRDPVVSLMVIASPIRVCDDKVVHPPVHLKRCRMGSRNHGDAREHLQQCAERMGPTHVRVNDVKPFVLDSGCDSLQLTRWKPVQARMFDVESTIRQLIVQP